MNKVSFIAMLLLISTSAAACKKDDKASNNSDAWPLGVVPIGGAPASLDIFSSSDCDTTTNKLTDCSARDMEGRRYSFFDGALSKVSAAHGETANTLRLPAGLKFGEDVALSAQKVASSLNIKLDRDISYDGKIVYSSDFVIKSKAGVFYSVELIADEDGRLSQVIERVDF